MYGKYLKVIFVIKRNPTEFADCKLSYFTYVRTLSRNNRAKHLFLACARLKLAFVGRKKIDNTLKYKRQS